MHLKQRNCSPCLYQSTLTFAEQFGSPYCYMSQWTQVLSHLLSQSTMISCITVNRSCQRMWKHENTSTFCSCAVANHKHLSSNSIWLDIKQHAIWPMNYGPRRLVVNKSCRVKRHVEYVEHSLTCLACSQRIHSDTS